MMTAHPQAWTKVNAPVDKGVQGLVGVLSEFGQLETIESCEAGGRNGPWVCFRYGAYWEHPWRDLADFVLGFMAPRLAELVGDDASVRIQATPSGQIFGELSTRPEAVSTIETALRQMVREFNGALRRSSECCDGTSGTSP